MDDVAYKGYDPKTGLVKVYRGHGDSYETGDGTGLVREVSKKGNTKDKGSKADDGER